MKNMIHKFANKILRRKIYACINNRKIMNIFHEFMQFNHDFMKISHEIMNKDMHDFMKENS